MNSRVRTGLLIAIAGLFLIAVGVFAAIRFLDINIIPSGISPTPTPAAETKVKVAFAANDVAAGTVLTEQDVTLAEIPLVYAPRDTIPNLDNAVGRISKVDLFGGEMILQHNLADPTGQIYDIAYILDEAHVLMAMPATDLMSKESLIKRGDIVGILVSIEEKLAPGDQTTGATEEEAKNAQQVSFSAFKRLEITAIVIDIIQDEGGNTAAGATPQANVGPRRDQVVIQAYLIALDPQSALVLKYLKDAGAIFDFVLLAPTSSGQFDLTPVTSQFIKELYGLELLP